MSILNTELLTVQEVAKLLRVDDSTVRRWANSGVLECVSLPRKGKRHMVRFAASTLETLVQSQVQA